jgi:hypothetical protein
MATLNIDAQRLQEGLVTVAYGGLSGVLAEIVDFLNRQAAQIMRLEGEIVAAKDETARETARATKREEDLAKEIALLKSVLVLALC